MYIDDLMRNESLGFHREKDMKAQLIIEMEGKKTRISNSKVKFNNFSLIMHRLLVY